MVMPKHPVKTIGNSFNQQILVAIDKSTSKNKQLKINTSLWMRSEKIEFEVI